MSRAALLLVLLAVSPWAELGVGSATGGGISATSTGSDDPAMALDAAGNPCVAWSEDLGGGVLEIYVKRWNGTAWAEVGAGSASGGGISGQGRRSQRPSIAVDSQGRPVVAWTLSTLTDDEIHVRFWNGAAWVPYAAGTVSETPAGSSRQPSIALDAADLPVVAWFDTASGNAEIYVRRWDGLAWVEIGAGSASGGGISNTAGPSETPSLALDSLGRPVVAWADRAGTFDILVRRWDGLAWVDVGASPSLSADSSINPSLALDASGRPGVAWQEFVGGNFEIYYRAWDGLAWVELGGSANGGGLSGTAGYSQYASLAIDAGDRPWIAWADFAGGFQEIYVLRWDGTAWIEAGAGSATGGGVSDTPGDDSNKPRLGVTAGGLPIAAWQEESDIHVRQGGAVPPPPPPPPPTVPGPLDLKQFQQNGQTFAPFVGGSTPLEEVVRQARISTAAAGPMRLQVEVRRVTTSFTGTPTAEGALEAPGVETFVLMGPLTSDAYHWQARAVDGAGTASAWLSYGGNAETEADFAVALTGTSTSVVVNEEGSRCGLLGMEAGLLLLLFRVPRRRQRGRNWTAPRSGRAPLK